MDPANEALSDILRKPKCFELNCSAQFTSFIVRRYAHFDKKDVNSLRVGEGFRLYHSQAESFIHASCNPDKGGKGAVVREKVNGTIFPHGHIPYLKGLADLGEDPDPSNPMHQVQDPQLSRASPPTYMPALNDA